MIAKNRAAAHMLTILKSLKMETNTMISSSGWWRHRVQYESDLIQLIISFSFSLFHLKNSFLSFLPSFLELLWESKISLFLYSESQLSLQTIHLSSWISTNKPVDNGFCYSLCMIRVNLVTSFPALSNPHTLNEFVVWGAEFCLWIFLFVCPCERTLRLVASWPCFWFYVHSCEGVGDNALPPLPNTHGQPELSRAAWITVGSLN